VTDERNIHAAMAYRCCSGVERTLPRPKGLLLVYSQFSISPRVASKENFGADDLKDAAFDLRSASSIHTTPCPSIPALTNPAIACTEPAGRLVKPPSAQTMRWSGSSPARTARTELRHAAEARPRRGIGRRCRPRPWGCSPGRKTRGTNGAHG